MSYFEWKRMGLVFAATGIGAGTAAAAIHLGPLPIPVWNQAYQENYDPDAIPDLLAGASNAYVLIYPFQPEHGDTMIGVIEQLHAKGNAVSAYISVGTGEDWRDDFAQLQPHLVKRQ